MKLVFLEHKNLYRHYTYAIAEHAVPFDLAQDMLCPACWEKQGTLFAARAHLNVSASSSAHASIKAGLRKSPSGYFALFKRKRSKG